jgi:hypothetical protein
MLGQRRFFHLGGEGTSSTHMHRILHVNEVVILNAGRNRRLPSLCGSTFQEVQAATLAADQKTWKTGIARGKDTVNSIDEVKKVRI